VSWDEQAAAFKAAFREHGGRLDVVVANAGVSEQGATTLVRLDGGEEEAEPSRPKMATVEVNLVGAIYCKLSCSSVPFPFHFGLG
jgi:NAD(P)-dependent dehydrogenase (short-subunit alcohol dehydrogenase family)